MNKLKFGIIAFTIVISINGFSQENGFNLSKYKLPDLKRRTLETNFNFSGTNNYRKIPDKPHYDGKEIANNLYNGDIYVDYRYFLNNSELQRESRFGLNFSSDLSNKKNDNELIEKHNQFTPSSYYRLVNRKYYKGLSFIETNIDLNYQYDYSKLFSTLFGTETNETETLQTHTILGNVPLKLGKGRIEPVQDARHAVYIFEELSKIGKITSAKTDEEIIEFAHLISELKNERFFDFRLRRMAELERLDSFLVSNNHISEQDIEYFTTLSDYWAYGNRPFRKSGTRFSVVLKPGFYYYYNNNPLDMQFNAANYNQHAFLLDGGIEFTHEKPVNLYWQHSIDVEIFAGIIEGNYNSTEYPLEHKVRIPNFQINYYQSFGYYPNTRTDVRFRYSVQYKQVFDASPMANEITGIEGQGAKAATYLIINYYISPRVRLNVTSSFHYLWQDTENDVQILFNNTTVSNDLLNYFGSVVSAQSYFSTKKIFNNFRVSFIYSIF